MVADTFIRPLPAIHAVQQPVQCWRRVDGMHRLIPATQILLCHLSLGDDVTKPSPTGMMPQISWFLARKSKDDLESTSPSTEGLQ